MDSVVKGLLDQVPFLRGAAMAARLATVGAARILFDISPSASFVNTPTTAGIPLEVVRGGANVIRQVAKNQIRSAEEQINVVSDVLFSPKARGVSNISSFPYNSFDHHEAQQTVLRAVETANSDQGVNKMYSLDSLYIRAKH
eukprot:GEZU01001384.1.p1 GENE.GEZU01001384.1~~GEZU01001384.1.p1  ORF type:complete len:142 (+),score=6.48 GEZU01001384.1:14-439(+)